MNAISIVKTFKDKYSLKTLNISQYKHRRKCIFHWLLLEKIFKVVIKKIMKMGLQYNYLWLKQNNGRVCNCLEKRSL